jgi:nucleoside-diphosphate-sugar epimerase
MMFWWPQGVSMPKAVFLAGASGVIGRRLVPLLVDAGHRVTGTTRSKEKAETLRAQGAVPAIVDAFDAAALAEAMQRASPDVVIHQLTDLTLFNDEAKRAEALERNSRIREEGTVNLVAAALASGVRRVIAQSISFVYAPGTKPHRESDPLNLTDPRYKRSSEGVAALEREVTRTPGIDGIVLRYGWFYGPGTGSDVPRFPGSVHVDAAAKAALLAIDRGSSGIYNVAEDDGDVNIDKARAELGFDPAFRMQSTWA